MTTEVVLYVDRLRMSPYAMSAFVALREKGIAFELRSIDLDSGEQHGDLYRGLSLTHRVPTLKHGDFVLSESSAIAEYLDDVYPGPQYPRLYPVAAAERARARQVQAWLRSDFMPIRQERTTEVVFRTPVRSALSAEAGAMSQRLFAALDVMSPAAGDDLFGQWCIADSDLALMIQRLLRCGDPVPPRWVRYAQHQWQRPGVRAWVEFARD